MLELMDCSQELCVGGSWVAVFALIVPVTDDCASTKRASSILDMTPVLNTNTI